MSQSDEPFDGVEFKPERAFLEALFVAAPTSEELPYEARMNWLMLTWVEGERIYFAYRFRYLDGKCRWYGDSKVGTVDTPSARRNAAGAARLTSGLSAKRNQQPLVIIPLHGMPGPKAMRILCQAGLGLDGLQQVNFQTSDGGFTFEPAPSTEARS